MTELRSALVLPSGCQGSRACLAGALGREAHGETIGFDCRQRHRVELAAGQRLRVDPP
jgi:7-cyano-7-deazaguanine synthase